MGEPRRTGAMSSFRFESDMLEPAMRWLKGQDLLVKPEFAAPWGICDLVALQFHTTNVKRREKLGQLRSLGSAVRAEVLVRIPDEAERSISVTKLRMLCAHVVTPERLDQELERLESDRFIVETRRGQVARLNGWMPLYRRLIAIELKLSRIEEAMWQARMHLGFTSESYVGLPTEQAERTMRSRAGRERFERDGIGLLAVGRAECKVLIRPGKRTDLIDPAAQLHVIERFWSLRPRDKSS